MSDRTETYRLEVLASGFLFSFKKRYYILLVHGFTRKKYQKKKNLHLVFVPKYRRGLFTKEILDDLSIIFGSVCKDFDAILVEFNGEKDHVHLLVDYPPKVSVSRLVNSLKGVSSRLLRKKNYPSIVAALWKDSFWSPSYFASSCGGAPLSIIRAYIENQITP